MSRPVDVGQTVGQYEIRGSIGKGGMAEVYLALQSRPRRRVALKKMNALHDDDPSYAQRFLREADVAGSFSHPSVVTVHDYFEHDGTPYIAMEYVERGSLRPYVGTMTMAQICGVLDDVLAGLATAEQKGIVHRDLKPENLMVTSDGRVKIADFGIAKATSSLQTTAAFATATGVTVGTPMYIAPEQALAQDVGPWTDLYSLGCVAFELCIGRVPFHDSDAPMAILLRHVNEPIPPVKSIDPEIDQAVSDWIEQLLVKNPQERTQSASEAWDDFEEIIIGLLGPRWRRSARLPETPGAVRSRPAVPGPYTPPPKDMPPGPMTEAPAPEEPPAPVSAPVRLATSAEPVIAERLGAPVEATSAEPIERVRRRRFRRGPWKGRQRVAPPAPGAAQLPAADRRATVGPAARPARENTAQAGAPKRRPRRGRPAIVGDDLDAVAVGAQGSQSDLAAATGTETAPARRIRRRRVRARRRRVALAAVALCGIASVAAAVLLLLPPTSPTPAAAAPGDVLTSDEFTLQAPPDWKRLSAPVDIPGLPLKNATSAARGGNSLHGGLTVGLAPDTAQNATLLPDEFIERYGGRDALTSHRSELMLDDSNVQAVRYDGLRAPGIGRELTVFAIPTSRGISVLACTWARPGAAALTDACGASLESFDTHGAVTYPLAPSREYAKQIDGTIHGLAVDLKQPRSRLRAAETSQAQAPEAQKIAAAFQEAADELRAVDASPATAAARHALVRALAATAAEYRALARAADADDQAAYDAHRSRALTADARAAEALDGVAEDGYDALVRSKHEDGEIPELQPPPATAAQAGSGTSTGSGTTQGGGGDDSGGGGGAADGGGGSAGDA